MKRIPAILPALCLAACMLFHTGCAGGDETRVTIKLQRNDLTHAGIKPEREPRLIDKILNFFSTAAYAGGTWDGTKGTLTLEIEHPTLGKSTVPLATGATEYTTVLPVASGVKFIIRSTIDDSYSGTTLSNWGGQITADLQPSEADNVLTIIMLPVLPIAMASGNPTVSVQWYYYSTDSISITGTDQYIELYRSTAPDGDYVLVNSDTLQDSPGSLTDLPSVGGTYYYRTKFAATYNGKRYEGLMSDYASANVMF